MLTRRRLLGNFARLAATCAAIRLDHAWSAIGPPIAPVLRSLREHGAAAAIGRDYLARFPHENAVEPLLAVLAIQAQLAPAALLALPPAELWRQARAQRGRDFAAGDTVVLNGWILARSEARLCALAELLLKPAGAPSVISDLREHGEPGPVEADVCIIGAGAAGIAIARELAGTRCRALVAESGGLEFEQATQDLYKGEVAGLPYWPLDVPRLRMFGGSTNHWGAHCTPLEAVDLRERSWVPHSGWPFGREELDRHYPKAQSMVGLGEPNYDPAYWRIRGVELISFDQRKLINRIWQVADPPANFGRAYRAELCAAPNVHVLLHANASAIRCNPEGTLVEAVQLRSLDGRSLAVRARTFVLACGGIENARLLLASNDVEPHGLGNRHGLVGRFFMEHPHAIMAMAITDEPMSRFACYSAGVPADGISIWAKPGLNPLVQEREQLLNCCIDIGVGGDRSEGYSLLSRDAKALLHGELPGGIGADMLRIMGDLDGLLSGAYRRATSRSVLWFATNNEQAPNPDSRVTLGEERDALGLRRARLDWRLTELDKRTARFACRLVGEELARLGLGRMRLDRWMTDDDTGWPAISGRNHHLGTTRMHDDPKQGVVDRNGRLHGVANLYLAGGSVFPTSGYAHPTLTVIAMALRLADHLKQLGTTSAVVMP